MGLVGRVALVTGSGRGMGRAFAVALAAEGATIVVADINEPAAIEVAQGINASGEQAMPLQFDQADDASIKRMVRAAQKEFGAIDILVNNAALFADLERRRALEIELDEWQRVLAVNLSGPFICATAVLPTMIERGYGKIVNVVSAGIFSTRNRLAHYNAAKSGLIGLTRSLAREYGPDGVRVNALSPGATDTGAAISNRKYLDALSAERSIPRVQIPSDVTGALVFLCSPFSDFVTGQHLVVDGGLVFH